MPGNSTRSDYPKIVADAPAFPKGDISGGQQVHWRVICLNMFCRVPSNLLRRESGKLTQHGMGFKEGFALHSLNITMQYT